jgi:hypothetical protein
MDYTQTNPIWVDPEHTQIDIAIGTDTVRINATPGLLHYDGLMAAGIAIADPPVSVPQSISDRQFFQQLAVQGIISQADALAANAAVIPPALLTLINAMPSAQ